MRWDKNFLTLIHLTLARREKLRIYGGIRFGGTLPLEEAWAYGIDHVAIAAGAGPADDHRHQEQPDPRHPQGQRLPDGAAAHGAFKEDALSNLQVRLPAVVIGGGLTGIDTATELLAYYPLQVEKMLRPLRGARARDRRGRGARHARSRGAGHPRRVPRARPRGARRARARARRPARRRTSSRSCGSGAASRSPIASACRIRPPIV